MDAVRIALTIGVTRRPVADDLVPTLNTWATAKRQVVSKEDLSLVQQNDQPRRENAVSRGKGPPKKGDGVLRAPTTVGFKIIEEHQSAVSIGRM